MGVAERLYYPDSYLTHFSANIIKIADSGHRIYLDRTAFYPTSGGQLFDRGRLGPANVTDVVDEDGTIAHIVDTPLPAGPIEGWIDWQRRFDHMQQHTGQHLLSAVIAEHFGLETISVHLGEQTSTIDLDTPAIDASMIVKTERLANEEIARNRPVLISFEDAATAEGLRKVSDRSGTLRIITIEGLDRSACGGTHVHATGEIGVLLLRKTEKIRNSTRIEFVCGLRAVDTTRADFAILKEQATSYQARLGEAEKNRRKLLVELAGFRGRELYQVTTPEANGIRRAIRRVSEIDETIRGEAQAFIQGAHAIYVALTDSSILLAASPDSGINAGSLVKNIATRGGGTATIAQGSIADPNAALTAISQ